MKIPDFLDRDVLNPVGFDSRFLKKGIIALGTVLIMLAWCLFLFQVDKNKKELVAGLEREQQNLAGVLAENLFQILEQRHTIELFASKWFDGTKSPSGDITGFLYGERTFTRIVLYDLSGRSFYESSPGSGDRPDKIREQIEKMLGSGQPVVMPRDNRLSNISWQVPFLFPIGIGAAVKGAMLLEMDFGYFLNLLQNIDIGRTGTITVQHDQGEEVARFESGGLVVGNSPVKMMPAGSISGVSGFRDGRYSDFGNCYLTYLRVHDYPFMITISIGQDEFLSDFNQYRNRLLWVLIILTSLGLSGIVLLFKMINRNQAYLDALALFNQENQRLIQNLEKEHKASSRAASFDPLTELYNRNLFISLAEKSILQAKRNKFCYAVLFIDLDRFKKINDTLGHHIGDLLLKEVSLRLKMCTRKSDIVSRFGGDEFVVMLTEVARERDIATVVENITAVVSKPCPDLDGHEIITSPSVGISVYPRDGEDIETLLLNADAAMYKAKKSGRGQYRFFDPSLNTVSVEKFALEQRMPSAITQGEFTLHYQPKVRLQDYRVVGLEALIRWRHPHHGMIFPPDFIGIAEETGLIMDLGAWVVEAACRQLNNWRAAGMDLIPIAVNVSPLELKDRAYANRFQNILKQHDIPFKYIEIEVTENAFIDDRDIVINNLKALFDKGVKIFLDDFGTGFSSLEHIRFLPVNSLKIDRSFIQDIRNSYHDNPIVSSTITLAKKLNLTVVAEGVETSDQLISLRVAGCEQVQGYLFSRPVSENKIREFIISPVRKI
ncbi:bifunctional diguanylate cyclase/phosphodiesterase [Desulfobacter vibrioformis]|uniref:bifunctional diguanylate cyclase/phosphodiesterase n=1 Tax=Desulfobacter vibrioformis TaxID=34031 RepID=UPI0014705596|nr:EAL domain-containing protein [Desulfobacter vibrioformis]